MPKTALKKKCGNPNCSNPKCPFPHYASGTPETPASPPPKERIRATLVRDRNETRDFMKLTNLSDDIKPAMKGPSKRSELTSVLERHCVECRSQFTISIEQQRWYFDREFNLPKRCSVCRKVRRYNE
jgi:hypothetical protein